MRCQTCGRRIRKRGHNQRRCQGCAKAQEKRLHNRAKNKHYQRISDRIVKLKQRPCKDCKHRFPSCCMDFHHVRGSKKFSIGRMVTNCNWELIKKEIAKCVLICANCHRIRTWLKPKD